MSGEEPPKIPVTPPNKEQEVPGGDNEDIIDAEFTDIGPHPEESITPEQEARFAEAGAKLEALRETLGIGAKDNKLEPLTSTAPTIFEAPIEPESDEAHESKEDGSEHPKEHTEDPTHKKAEEHSKEAPHGKDDKHEKHESHGHGHEKPSFKKQVIGAAAFTAGGALLGAGLLGESAEVINLLGLHAVVSSSLTGIGLSAAGGLGILYGLGSLGALSFLGNLVGAAWEELKANPPWKGLIKGGKGGGGGGGNAPAAPH